MNIYLLPTEKSPWLTLDTKQFNSKEFKWAECHFQCEDVGNVAYKAGATGCICIKYCDDGERNNFNKMRLIINKELFEWLVIWNSKRRMSMPGWRSRVNDMML